MKTVSYSCDVCGMNLDDDCVHVAVIIKCDEDVCDLKIIDCCPDHATDVKLNAIDTIKLFIANKFAVPESGGNLTVVPNSVFDLLDQFRQLLNDRKIKKVLGDRINNILAMITKVEQEGNSSLSKPSTVPSMASAPTIPDGPPPVEKQPEVKKVPVAAMKITFDENEDDIVGRKRR